MQENTIQFQSVLYGNDKQSIKKALDCIANAVRVVRSTDLKVGNVVVYYGDATASRLYSGEEISQLQQEFGEYFELKYKFFNENTGSAKGQTILGKESTSEYIFVMNPDVRVCPRFFEKILRPFLTRNDVVISEARQTPIEHSKYYDRKTFETEWATGACFLVRTEDFKLVNGFDYNTFFLYYDDVDISWRLRLATGRKIIYVPDCPVYHAKNLSKDCKMIVTKAEIYYTAEALMLMSYKWSFDDKFEKLYHELKASPDEIYNKVAARFDELKEKNLLPERLDKEHKVSKLYGDYFTNHRFIM